MTSFFHLQDLIDKARITLVGNRSLLQRMQASSGLTTINDSDDLEYTNLNQVILQNQQYYILSSIWWTYFLFFSFFEC